MGVVLPMTPFSFLTYEISNKLRPVQFGDNWIPKRIGHSWARRVRERNTGGAAIQSAQIAGFRRFTPSKIRPA